MSTTDWSQLSEFPSHARKVRSAVYEVLAANEALAAFLADESNVPAARLYQVTVPGIPDMPIPFSYVRLVVEQRTSAVQNLNDLRLTVAVGLVFDESRATVEDGDEGFEDWANAVMCVLYGNPMLEGTSQNGGAALVLSLEGFDSLPVEVLNDAGEDGVTCVKEIFANYTYQVDAASGVFT